MRSKTDWVRCGCGQLHGPRESCPACAQTARAKLHASGVATARRDANPVKRPDCWVKPATGVSVDGVPPGGERIPIGPLVVRRPLLGRQAWARDEPVVDTQAD